MIKSKKKKITKEQFHLITSMISSYQQYVNDNFSLCLSRGTPAIESDYQKYRKQIIVTSRPLGSVDRDKLKPLDTKNLIVSESPSLSSDFNNVAFLDKNDGEKQVEHIMISSSLNHEFVKCSYVINYLLKPYIQTFSYSKILSYFSFNSYSKDFYYHSDHSTILKNICNNQTIINELAKLSKKPDDFKRWCKVAPLSFLKDHNPSQLKLYIGQPEQTSVMESIKLFGEHLLPETIKTIQEVNPKVNTDAKYACCLADALVRIGDTQQALKWQKLADEISQKEKKGDFYLIEAHSFRAESFCSLVSSQVPKVQDKILLVGFLLKEILNSKAIKDHNKEILALQYVTGLMSDNAIVVKRSTPSSTKDAALIDLIDKSLKAAIDHANSVMANNSKLNISQIWEAKSLMESSQYPIKEAVNSIVSKFMLQSVMQEKVDSASKEQEADGAIENKKRKNKI